MVEKRKTSIQANGIKVLLSGHPAVRRLKRNHAPSAHGHKFWTSSWLVMDFLREQGMAANTHVMEIGCGWGLAAIYCARTFGARATGVDIDPEVFPYLELHAQLNKVAVNTLHKGFDDIRAADLRDVDVLIGADICFWDEMVDPLKRLINRAVRAGVKHVILADPGRSPYEALATHFAKTKNAGSELRSVKRPRHISGKLMHLAV